MSSIGRTGPGQWPALALEQVPWVSKYEQGSASRIEIRKHQGPYAAAIPAEIAGLPGRGSHRIRNSGRGASSFSLLWPLKWRGRKPADQSGLAPTTEVS